MEIPEEFQPRHGCAIYMRKDTAKQPVLLSKEDFNKNLEEKNFRDGPYRDPFGTGHGEPYYPWTQAYGTLKDGIPVYCELQKDNNNEAKSFLEKLAQE